MLFTYGLETAFFRFANKTESPKTVFGTAYISLIFSSVILIIIGTLLWPSISEVDISIITIFKEHTGYLVYLGAILLVDTLAAIPYASLRQQNRPIKFAVIKIAGMAAFLILNIFFLWFCPGVMEGKFAAFAKDFVSSFYKAGHSLDYIFLSNLFASLLSYLLLWPEVLGFRYGFDKTLWKEMTKFAWPLLIAGLLGMTNETLDRILIPELIDGQEGLIKNGIYSQCYKISIFLTIFVQAFKFAAEPFFFSKANDSNAPRIYALVMDWFVLVCLGAFTIIILYLDVAKHLLNEKFWVGLEVVPILLLANLFMGIHTNLSIWYKVTDKTRWGLIIAFCGAVLTIILNIVWIPAFGYVGAAWATLLSYLSMALLSYFVGQYYYKIPYHVLRFSLLLISALFVTHLSDYIVYEYNIIGLFPKLLLNTGLLVVYSFLVWKLYIKSLLVESRELSNS